tara:strand:- start:1096 stop:1338 length:243 start_codon:yes stop_codon:yes gene_type:complete
MEGTRRVDSTDPEFNYEMLEIGESLYLFPKDEIGEIYGGERPLFSSVERVVNQEEGVFDIESVSSNELPIFTQKYFLRCD